MPATATFRRTDAAASSELYTLLVGRLYKSAPSRRPVIVCPGGALGDRGFLDDAAQGGQIYRDLADKGYPLDSPDGVGHSKFGNDTAQDRIGKAWTKVQADLGTATDKAILIGISNGASAVLNYTRNNPSNVAAGVLIVPAIDLSYLYANGFSAAIDTAYGGAAAWDAAKATHDPALNLATHASQATPWLVLYGSADTTIPPAMVTTFLDAVPSAQGVSYAGTTHTTTGPAIDPQTVAAFLSAYA